MRTRLVAATLPLVMMATACSSSPDVVTDTSAAPPTTTTSILSTSTGPTTTVATPADSQPTSTSVPIEEEPQTIGESPDGRFQYLVTYTNAAHLNGVLLVDNGTGPVPALRDDRDTFDSVHSMVFGPDGLVAWTSNDYAWGARVFVGRIDDSGRIVDSHRVGGWEDEVTTSGAFDELGRLTGSTYGGSEHVLDTDSDPFFVMSADPPLRIETDEPLATVLESEGYWALDDPGHWFRGETLGRDPACGGSTLYKDDPDGFSRVLDASIELETVVAVDVDAAFGSGGIDSVGGARAVVISTVCPNDYEGRRLFWGVERIDYGDGGPRFESPLMVESAAPMPVAKVLGITTVFRDQDCCPWPETLQIAVEFLDGNTGVLEVSV